MPFILLLSCYELGHQPLTLASPLAVLAQVGLAAHAVDLAVEPFPTEAAQRADFVGISVPMHTALRLGVEAARRIRTLNPAAKICFYGLYAGLNETYLRTSGLADHILAGEYETQLLHWLQNQLTIDNYQLPIVNSSPRQPYLLPQRDTLPALSSYAHLLCDDTAYPAGYTETTRGCLHTCTHCPVVPVYGGRFFAIRVETVLADIRQQVEMGAEHITFGDPDFLNGPTHALRVTRALHAEFPHLTFDFTTKVEHILRDGLAHPALFPEFRELGALFVVSAFESLSPETLIRLQKGHTPADLDAALDLLHAAELPVQPTFVAFAPWTTLDDYLTMLNWVRTRDLIMHVPVVQYAIRLLIPPKSALLNDPDTNSWLGPLDPENFSYTWAHPDPRMDALHEQISTLAERMAEADPRTAFEAIERVAYALSGRPAPPRVGRATLLPPPPRLTEDWFC